MEVPGNTNVDFSSKVFQQTFEDMHIDQQHAQQFSDAMKGGLSSTDDPELVADLQTLQQQLSNIQNSTQQGVNNIQSAANDPTQLDQIREQLLGQVQGLKSPTLPGPAQLNVGGDAMHFIQNEYNNYQKTKNNILNKLAEPGITADPSQMTQIQMKVGELHVMTSLFSQLAKKASEIVSTLFKNQ